MVTVVICHKPLFSVDGIQVMLDKVPDNYTTRCIDSSGVSWVLANVSLVYRWCVSFVVACVHSSSASPCR